MIPVLVPTFDKSWKTSARIPAAQRCRAMLSFSLTSGFCPREQTSTSHALSGELWREPMKHHDRLRADSRFVPSQWETTLLCNGVSHWLGTSLESALQTDLVSNSLYRTVAWIPVEKLLSSKCYRASMIKITLVQTISWCCQATRHYLSQSWGRSMSPYGVTRQQLIKAMWHIQSSAAITRFLGSKKSIAL